MSGKVQRVVVVGRDADLWMSVLALHRAVGGVGVTVEAVELPSLLSPIDAYAALPPFTALLKLVGLDGRDVLRVCRGVPVLGQRFVGWSSSERPFIHGYDIQRPAIDNVDFLQFWVEARQGGLEIPYEEFSPAAVAAKNGKVPDENAGTETLTSLGHGFHLHAQSFVLGLRRLAVERGVTVHAAPSVTAEHDGTRIDRLHLASASVEADIFVDASGDQAVLIEQLEGSAFESWDQWLPGNRMIAASGPRLAELPPFAEISAFDAGWIGLYPLQNATAARVVYDAARTSDRDAVNAIVKATGIPLSHVAAPLPVKAGMRTRCWAGNCIAIGGAAVGLAPLDATDLHVAQIGISHLIALFPSDRETMPEAQAYNALLDAHMLHLRDFQIAHFKLNGRIGEPFWDAARSRDVPDSLDTRLRLFGTRGIVPAEEHETFQEQNWASILIGHGLIPERYSPRVDAVPADEREQKLHRLLEVIAGEVRAMPSVRHYLGDAAGTR